MKKKWILASGIAAVGAFAFAMGTARAGACISAFQFVWLSQSRCPGVDGSLGFAQGFNGVPPSLNARLMVNMQVGVGGGAVDSARAFGFNNASQVVGTPACAQGAGAPGCLLCSVQDTNTSAASFSATPIGACVQAVKHRMQVSF